MGYAYPFWDSDTGPYYYLHFTIAPYELKMWMELKDNLLLEHA